MAAGLDNLYQSITVCRGPGRIRNQASLTRHWAICQRDQAMAPAGPALKLGTFYLPPSALALPPTSESPLIGAALRAALCRCYADDRGLVLYRLHTGQFHAFSINHNERSRGYLQWASLLEALRSVQPSTASLAAPAGIGIPAPGPATFDSGLLLLLLLAEAEWLDLQPQLIFRPWVAEHLRYRLAFEGIKASAKGRVKPNLYGSNLEVALLTGLQHLQMAGRP